MCVRVCSCACVFQERASKFLVFIFVHINWVFHINPWDEFTLVKSMVIMQEHRPLCGSSNKSNNLCTQKRGFFVEWSLWQIHVRIFLKKVSRSKNVTFRVGETSTHNCNQWYIPWTWSGHQVISCYTSPSLQCIFDDGQALGMRCLDLLHPSQWKEPVGEVLHDGQCHGLFRGLQVLCQNDPVIHEWIQSANLCR